MPKININMVKWLHDYLAIDKCQPNNIICVERDMIIAQFHIFHIENSLKCFDYRDMPS